MRLHKSKISIIFSLFLLLLNSVSYAQYGAIQQQNVRYGVLSKQLLYRQYNLITPNFKYYYDNNLPPNLRPPILPATQLMFQRLPQSGELQTSSRVRTSNIFKLSRINTGNMPQYRTGQILHHPEQIQPILIPRYKISNWPPKNTPKATGRIVTGSPRAQPIVYRKGIIPMKLPIGDTRRTSFIDSEVGNTTVKTNNYVGSSQNEQDNTSDEDPRSSESNDSTEGNKNEFVKEGRRTAWKNLGLEESEISVTSTKQLSHLTPTQLLATKNTNTVKEITEKKASAAISRKNSTPTETRTLTTDRIPQYNDPDSSETTSVESLLDNAQDITLKEVLKAKRNVEDEYLWSPSYYLIPSADIYHGKTKRRALAFTDPVHRFHSRKSESSELSTEKQKMASTLGETSGFGLTRRMGNESPGYQAVYRLSENEIMRRRSQTENVPKRTRNSEYGPPLLGGLTDISKSNGEEEDNDLNPHTTPELVVTTEQKHFEGILSKMEQYIDARIKSKLEHQHVVRDAGENSRVKKYKIDDEELQKNHHFPSHTSASKWKRTANYDPISPDKIPDSLSTERLGERMIGNKNNFNIENNHSDSESEEKFSESEEIEIPSFVDFKPNLDTNGMSGFGAISIPTSHILPQTPKLSLPTSSSHLPALFHPSHQLSNSFVNTVPLDQLSKDSSVSTQFLPYPSADTIPSTPSIEPLTQTKKIGEILEKIRDMNYKNRRNVTQREVTHKFKWNASTKNWDPIE